MKKILLLSDTHGYIDEPLLNHAKKVDEVWHAGDIGSSAVTDALANCATVRAVYGNIDDTGLRKQFPLDNNFTCEGVSVWITHIGGYPGRYEKRIRERLGYSAPQLFICGHSHILKVMRDKKHGLLHMNPGAIGKHGFHKVRTMLRFEVDKGGVQNLEVIEYPR
jgi:putative phosphoesterase